MNLFAKIFKKIIYFLCRASAIVVSYKRIEQFSLFKKILYTYWISGEFKSFGDKSIITYSFVLQGGKYITIGNNVILGSKGVLTAWDRYKGEKFHPEISIGDNTSIGEDFHITAINKVIIGNNVLMGKKITITDNSHGKTELRMLDLPPKDRPLFSKGHVVIEDNVWLGDKVTVLAGVKIGKNSIIGANSVVTSIIPANCVAAGVPAKIIKIIQE